ncbi:hypothetical protein E1218_13780 [Kribbella turkmenica]|uniref:Uncharacterized protein n=1 Tax=Kribbella turkmenica TaxID=2530375 RepID=A0A4R4X712_9ACTN|nr:hypothetical protein [Kribbella turkmenica]TDD26142.1 hypothetical protein E1218_13780 [Kribbella turkmenica]
MGTQEEEAAARAELERVRTENAIKAMQREEELRKLREQEGQSSMVGDAPAAWPDGEMQGAPSTRDKVAGALRVGRAGDAAFARDLLNSGQVPLSGAEAPVAGGDGAREQSGAGRHVGKPALGLG